MHHTTLTTTPQTSPQTSPRLLRACARLQNTGNLPSFRMKLWRALQITCKNLLLLTFFFSYAAITASENQLDHKDITLKITEEVATTASENQSDRKDIAIKTIEKLMLNHDVKNNEIISSDFKESLTNIDSHLDDDSTSLHNAASCND